MLHSRVPFQRLITFVNIDVILYSNIETKNFRMSRAVPLSKGRATSRLARHNGIPVTGCWNHSLRGGHRSNSNSSLQLLNACRQLAGNLPAMQIVRINHLLNCMPLCASANPAVCLAQQREGQRQQATSSTRRRCDHSPNGRQRSNHEPQKYAQQHVHWRANNGLHEINRQHWTYESG